MTSSSTSPPLSVCLSPLCIIGVGLRAIMVLWLLAVGLYCGFVRGGGVHRCSWSHWHSDTKSIHLSLRALKRLDLPKQSWGATLRVLHKHMWGRSIHLLRQTVRTLLYKSKTQMRYFNYTHSSNTHFQLGRAIFVLHCPLQARPGIASIREITESIVTLPLSTDLIIQKLNSSNAKLLAAAFSAQKILCQLF